MLYLVMLCSASIAQKRNVYISLSNSKEINVPEENYISAFDIGAVFEIENYFYVGAGINATKVWGKGYSSLGIGAGPEIQFYVYKREKLKLFLEGKGRVMYLFPEYPGTELNFAFWGGPGAEIFLTNRNRLKIGFCYNHLSNGKDTEQYMNQNLDGLGLTIGWFFY